MYETKKYNEREEDRQTERKKELFLHTYNTEERPKRYYSWFLTEVSGNAEQKGRHLGLENKPVSNQSRDTIYLTREQ